jgi:hypothetical protein
MHAADDVTVPHLFGYEPIMAPFGFGALPGLHRADADGDYDASVEVALRDVTGMPPEVIADLRAETPVWTSCGVSARPSTQRHARSTRTRALPRGHPEHSGST